MQRYKILHRTYYNFAALVQIGPHVLHLRPREGHELRIESSSLKITPPASLRWHRDVEDNSVATAIFETSASQLLIESEVIIQQYNQTPFDFLVAEYATGYPFIYLPEDQMVLSPYLNLALSTDITRLDKWIEVLWQPGESISSVEILQRVSGNICKTMRYQVREEPGVQSIQETLSAGGGSCRDLAFLFMEAVRRLGFAVRFVSGYLHSPPVDSNFGATHAWAEVFLPGAGWKGFDPTLGVLAATNHIAVAAAVIPESVPPVAGSFTGPPGAKLDVGVWVTEL